MVTRRHLAETAPPVNYSWGIQSSIGYPNVPPAGRSDRGPRRRAGPLCNFATSPAGFTYQLTMRAARVADVLSQAAQLEAWLTSHNWTPGKAPGKASQGDAANSVQSEAAPVCAIHGKPMTRRTTKDGTRSFWSCSERLSDGSYCPYRPPKQ